MGSCLTLRNELYKETHKLTVQRDFIGKGRPGREQEGQRNRKDCSAARLRAPGFW